MSNYTKKNLSRSCQDFSRSNRKIHSTDQGENYFGEEPFFLLYSMLTFCRINSIHALISTFLRLFSNRKTKSIDLNFVSKKKREKVKCKYLTYCHINMKDRISYLTRNNRIVTKINDTTTTRRRRRRRKRKLTRKQ